MQLTACSQSGNIIEGLFVHRILIAKPEARRDDKSCFATELLWVHGNYSGQRLGCAVKLTWIKSQLHKLYVSELTD